MIMALNQFFYLLTYLLTQQTTIDDLRRKLNFVLSFLDINNDTGIEERDD